MKRIISGIIFLAFGAIPALAQAPPPIPPIADATRGVTYNITSSTPQVQVPFPVFGDCTDIQVQINNVTVPLPTSLWNCASASGTALNLLPLPITDMVVNFTPALTSGSTTITGTWHPRNLTVPTAPGINRREYEQAVSTIIANNRELYTGLQASGSLPLTATLASPPPIGNVLPNTGAFTSLSSTLASTIAGIPFNPSVPVTSSFAEPNRPGILVPAGTAFHVACSPATVGQDTPAGCIYVVKNAAYTGVPTGIPPAAYFLNNINAGVQGPQAGLISYEVNSNTLTSQPSGTSGGIGHESIGICNVAGCTANWAAVLAGYDTTGQINPSNSFYSTEADMYAHGPDNNNVRIGLQIVCSTPDGLGTLATCGRAILLSGIGAASTGQFGTLIDGSISSTVHGILLASMTFRAGAASVAFSSPGYQLNGIGDVVARSLNIPVNQALSWGTLQAQIVLNTDLFLDNLVPGDFVFRTTAFAEVARITKLGGIKTVGQTFAGLGTCNAGRDGEQGFITDDTATVVYRASANGGGTTHAKVICINGAGWLFD